MERQSTYGHKRTNEALHVRNKKAKEKHPGMHGGVRSATCLATGENDLEKSVNIDHSQLSCPKKPSS